MIAQLRWVASGTAAPPIELGRLLHRLGHHVRHSSCWLHTQHARAVLQVDRSGRVTSRVRTVDTSRAVGRRHGEARGLCR